MRSPSSEDPTPPARVQLQGGERRGRNPFKNGDPLGVADILVAEDGSWLGHPRLRRSWTVVKMALERLSDLKERVQEAVVEPITEETPISGLRTSKRSQCRLMDQLTVAIGELEGMERTEAPVDHEAYNYLSEDVSQLLEDTRILVDEISNVEERVEELKKQRLAEREQQRQDMLVERQERLAEAERLARRDEAERQERLAEAERSAKRAEAEWQARLTEADRSARQNEAEREHQRAMARERLRLEAAQVERETRGNGGSNHNETEQYTRLPKLEIEKFGGDLLKWKGFWDVFSVTVDQTKMPDALKMSHLKCLLFGTASKSIEGLVTSADNYQLAVKTLKERFGQPGAVVGAHVAAIQRMRNPNPSPKSLRIFLDEMEIHLKTLEASKASVENAFVLSIIQQKLPYVVKVRLEERKGDGEWTLAEYRKTLARYVEMHERLTLLAPRDDRPPFLRGDQQWDERYHQPPPKRPYLPLLPRTTDALTGITEAKRFCAFCQGKNHWSDQCQTFVTIEERKGQIRGRCFICLKADHQMRSCGNAKPCFYCKQVGRHHSSLCPKRFPLRPGEQPTARQPANVPPGQSASVLSTNTNMEINAAGDQVTVETTNALALCERTILQTASVLLTNPTDPRKCESARVFFDTGSTRSYIMKSMVEKLGLKETGRECLETYIFNRKEPALHDSKIVTVNLFLPSDNSSLPITLNEVGFIVGTKKPSKTLDITKLAKGYKLADDPNRIGDHSGFDVLLGEDYYHEIVGTKRLEVRDGLYLIESKLGWIFGGRTKEVTEKDSVSSMVMFCEVATPPGLQKPYFPPDEPLAAQCDERVLWEVENLGIRESIEEQDDDIAVDRLSRTIQFKDGRYEVGWPWKTENPELPDNYALAENRLRSLVNRMKRNPGLEEKYTAILKDQLEKGIIEKVERQQKDGPLEHYLPHHPILTPMKTTTKVRIVHDASAKNAFDEKSLNQHLLRGPIKLDNVASLLISARLAPILIISDIEKAFLQIALRKADREVTRFLYLKDPKKLTVEDNIEILRYCRVGFGFVSAPYILEFSLDFHCKKEGTPVAMEIAEKRYMDNIQGNKWSEAEARDFYFEAKDILRRAGMNLREWSSNFLELEQVVEPGDWADSRKQSLLGIEWDRERDTLCLFDHLRVEDYVATTKREVMRRYAKFFDPNGLLNPAFLPVKLFVQDMFRQGLTWDEPLPKHLQRQCDTFVNNFTSPSSIKLPRYIGPAERIRPTRTELHCFTDASPRAYGLCVYLRVSTEDSVTVNLVFAKGKVAPMRKNIPSIPRLELLAVNIGTRATEFVAKAVKEVDEMVLWTDSLCVLWWLRTLKPLGVYVGNRVKSIQSRPKVKIKYVKRQYNPADIATKGCTLEELKYNQMWWHGPAWLSKPKTKFPPPSEPELRDWEKLETEAELRKEQPVVVAIVDETVGPGLLDITRFSKISKLLNATVFVYRMVERRNYWPSRMLVMRIWTLISCSFVAP